MGGFKCHIPPIAMLHLPLLSLDGSVEGNWPVWCVGSKRTIDNMSQKTCKEARKYTPVLIGDQRPYISDIYFNELALGSGYSISEIFFCDFLVTYTTGSGLSYSWFNQPHQQLVDATTSS